MDKQKVSLGCGTLILIALIVLIFGNGGRSSEEELRRLRTDVQKLEETNTRLEHSITKQSREIESLQDQIKSLEQTVNRLTPASPPPAKTRAKTSSQAVTQGIPSGTRPGFEAPVFRAETYLEANPLLGTPFRETDVKTRLERVDLVTRETAFLVKSDTVWTLALGKLREMAEFKAMGDAEFSRTLSRLRDDADIRPIPNTNLVQIAIAGKDPALLAPVANALAQAMVDAAGSEGMSHWTKDLRIRSPATLPRESDSQ